MSATESHERTSLDVMPLGRAVTDVATAWDFRMEQLMRRETEIIAFRGAGSNNGIDLKAAEHVLEDELIPRIDRRIRERPVAILYDGDPDNPEKPDIGYVVGRLQDRFQTREDAVSFHVAQAFDWYFPPESGSNLANAHGLPSETYVFPRDMYPGDHNRFTQSGQLAAYPLYEQVYVGASGVLAADQMAAYCRNVPPGHPVNVTVIRALINGSLSDIIGEKLAKATTDAEREKLEQTIEQRRRVYGKHWTNDGQFDEEVLEEIRREDDSHQLVALWEDDATVAIVNAERIDLDTPEIDQLFASARKYVKTQPIRARQIPVGTTETFVVNSGATRDTVSGGAWACTSHGTDEEYPVYEDDFPRLYRHMPGTDGWFEPIPDPRKLVKVDRDVIFEPSWGGVQAIRAGGYLMERVIDYGDKAGQRERYGISAKNAADFEPA